MTREFVLLRLECEYMYRQSGRKWSLSTIPDPCDPYLVRYAMLASIAEEVVEAFNWRLANGLRRNGDIVRKTMENPYPAFDPEVKPSWTSLVPPIQAEDLSELPSDMVRNRLLVLDEDGRLRTLPVEISSPQLVICILLEQEHNLSSERTLRAHLVFIYHSLQRTFLDSRDHILPLATNHY